MLIRPARADELSNLSALCLRSKAYWGYDASFLEACRAELTLTGADLHESTVGVSEVDGVPTGVAQVEVAGESCELGLLFVDPPWIGQGHGKALLHWAIKIGRDRGASHMRIGADPGAQGFYESMGAHQVGVVPSGAIAGRVLPLLELPLAPGAGSR